MKKFISIIAGLVLASSAFALPYSHRVYTKGEVDVLVGAVTTAHTSTVAKAASAIQPTTATYTSTVARAASALQTTVGVTTNITVLNSNGTSNTLTIANGLITVVQ